VANKKTVTGELGGFLPRAAALFLDCALILGSFVFISLFTAIILPNLFRAFPKEQAGLLTGLILGSLYLGIPWLYFTISTAIWGCTLGKFIFNLRVVRLDGSKVSLPISLWRSLCNLLFAIPLGLGYWVELFQKDKRSLADLASNTKVVLIKPYNEIVMILILVLLPFFGIAVCGILAAIAIPRFAQMLEKSREGATKGNLGTIKSAVAIYYGENNGKYPANLEKDLVPKYLTAIPPVKATGAFIARAPSPVGNNVTLTEKGGVPTQSGSGWLYDSTMGIVYINSTVKDSKGVPYSFYGFE
jgi:general secretion pathway protein G